MSALSNVDRSIKDPSTFAQTNVMDILTLLQATKLYWEIPAGKVCREMVYGMLDFDGTFFMEETKYQLHSSYSASKAGRDHFVRAFHDMYGMPIIVTNCFYNCGPICFLKN